jgi:RHS repeat-associated protein
MGRTNTSADRNGNVHTYTFDARGQLISDEVTTLGAGVDGAVRKIAYNYDTLGNLQRVTSYNAANEIVNEVVREFNGFGQLIREYQSTNGPVTVDTLAVEYAFDVSSPSPSGTGGYSRLSKITYPSGYELDYNYATGLGDNVSRLSSISDHVGDVEKYRYMGLSTVIERGRGSLLRWTLIPQLGAGSSDAGDEVQGLDRFGRVVKMEWYSSDDDIDLAAFAYGYDKAGNRLYREDLVNGQFSELYEYDSLNQLTSFNRGALNSAKNAIDDPTTQQSWVHDALGNWTSFNSDGVEQERAHNAQNELLEFGVVEDLFYTLEYDANGNLATIQGQHGFVYDAWNRLVEIRAADFETPVKAYTYDGLNRRVTENDWTSNIDLYYSAAGQVLEERERHWTEDPDIAAAVARYVWSPVYVNALILRDRDTDGNGSLEERLWAVQDANWNVVALVDSSGDVVERYAYTPYGQAFIMNGAYVEMTGGGVDWRYLFQGGRLDPLTGATQFGARDYDPALGRWRTLDPIGFAGGDLNVYRAFANNPVRYVDPTGKLVPLLAGGLILTWMLAEESPAQAPTYPGEHVGRRGFDLEVAAVTTAPFVAMKAIPYLYSLSVGVSRITILLAARAPSIAGVGVAVGDRARTVATALGQKAAELGARMGQMLGAPGTARMAGGPFKGFPEWGRDTVKWGSGAKEAASRAAEITAQEAKALDAAKVLEAKSFYEAIFREFPSNAAAKARAELMDKILKLQRGY